MGHLFYKVFTVYNTINTSLPSTNNSLNPDSQTNGAIPRLPGLFFYPRLPILLFQLHPPARMQPRRGYPMLSSFDWQFHLPVIHLCLTCIEKLLRIIKWTRKMVYSLKLNNRFVGEKLMKCTAQLTTYLYTHLYS